MTQERCAWVNDNPLYIHYHDHEWGVPVYDERLLFEFLILDAMATDLKKRGFKFTGSTICYAFMQATGMVNDHTMNCFCYKKKTNFNP